MGAHLAKSGKITNEMIMAAAETLPRLIPEEDKAVGCVYPRLSDIRSESYTYNAPSISLINKCLQNLTSFLNLLVMTWTVLKWYWSPEP